MTATGSVSVNVTTVVKASSSLKQKNLGQRKIYRRLISGELTLADTDQTIPANQSPSAPAFVPSWTQGYVGKRHGHVISTISSSQYPTVLNGYFSGTVRAELTAVPASSSLYYSKQSRYVTKVYKLSASALLPDLPPGSTGSGPTNGLGIFQSSSGSFRTSGASYFEIFVPDRGRIRDIKIWVELIHENRTNPGGFIGSPFDAGRLANTRIGLMPPTKLFEWGVPLWNDQKAKNYNIFVTASLSKIADPVQGCFPLWMGVGGMLGIIALTGTSCDWNADMDMRCVFHDGAPIDSNPFLRNSEYTNYFSSSFYTVQTGPISASAPNTIGIQRYGTSKGYVPSYSGNLYPWFVDTRIPLGFLSQSTSTAYTASAVLSGWLSGPVVSGSPTPDVNEFNTSPLENLGPYFVRPCFPLLDDVYQEQIFSDPLYPNAAQLFQGWPTVQPKFLGFRKGLRGAQSYGTWTLKVYHNSSWWFRQFRIEMTIDQGEELSHTDFQRTWRHKSTAVVPVRQQGKKYVTQVVSGSGIFFDAGLSIVYAIPRESRGDGHGYGRTVGITDSTSSFPDYAVFTRITGALADRFFASASLTGSGGTAGALYAYLNNPFKTPYIPISSGSGVPVSTQTDVVDAKEIVNELFLDRARTSRAQRLTDLVSRLGTRRRKQDIIAEAVLSASRG